MNLVITMTPASIAALLGALIVLALVPGVSVLAVSSRAATAGFLHGASTTLGIVTADILFVLLAVFGLALLADTVGAAFDLIRYLGGVYLILLGIGLWRAGRRPERGQAQDPPRSLVSSFMLGLLVTLGDQKAILFYLGFLPAFVDLTAISGPDIGVIVACTVLAVGGAKLVYAWAASRAGTVFGVIFGAGRGRALSIAGGGVMIVVGAVLIFTAG